MPTQPPNSLDIFDLIASTKMINSEETRNAFETLCRFVISLEERITELEAMTEED